MEFYSVNFGIGDPTGWHFNHTHPFVLGMTTHSIVELPWVKEETAILCNAYDRHIIGEEFRYVVTFNQSNCKSNLNAQVK